MLHIALWTAVGIFVVSLIAGLILSEFFRRLWNATIGASGKYYISSPRERLSDWWFELDIKRRFRTIFRRLMRERA